jgi:hypothetical protein
VGDADVEHAGPSMSIGFALYDGRNGPTPEEVRVMANIDALAGMIALNMTRCLQIRSKVFPNARPEADPQSLADSMDLFISRQSRGSTRYCNVKIVPQTETKINQIFHTYFWTQDGKSLPLDVVLGLRNFRVVPFVEVEDVFVSKAVRSIQLKLRECIVIPAAERPSTRFSVCFPDRECTVEATMIPAEEVPLRLVGPTADTTNLKRHAVDAASDGNKKQKTEPHADNTSHDEVPPRPHSDDATDVDSATQPISDGKEEEEEDDII